MSLLLQTLMQFFPPTRHPSSNLFSPLLDQVAQHTGLYGISDAFIHLENDATGPESGNRVWVIQQPPEKRLCSSVYMNIHMHDVWPYVLISCRTSIQFWWYWHRALRNTLGTQLRTTWDRRKDKRWEFSVRRGSCTNLIVCFYFNRTNKTLFSLRVGHAQNIPLKTSWLQWQTTWEDQILG